MSEAPLYADFARLWGVAGAVSGAEGGVGVPGNHRSFVFSDTRTHTPSLSPSFSLVLSLWCAPFLSHPHSHKKHQRYRGNVRRPRGDWRCFGESGGRRSTLTPQVSLCLSLCLSLSLALPPSHYFSLSLPLFLSLPPSLPAALSLSLAVRSLFLGHTHTLTNIFHAPVLYLLSRAQKKPHFHSLSLSHTHTDSLSPTRSHSVSHTYTLSHRLVLVARREATPGYVGEEEGALVCFCCVLSFSLTHKHTHTHLSRT